MVLPYDTVAHGRGGRLALLLMFTGMFAIAAGKVYAEPPISSIGRVPAAASEPPICAHARDARARQSPAAPDLEAQCRAQGGGVIRSLGRIPANSGVRVPPVNIQSAPAFGSAQLSQGRVPNVVGMSYTKARDALTAAGYAIVDIWLDQPNPSLSFDQVEATKPVAGQLQLGGHVEIRMPGSLGGDSGSVRLNSRDAAQGDGFDLDTMRHMQVTGGADIALPNQGVESDGALIVGANGAIVTKVPLGLLDSTSQYVDCERALRDPPVSLDVATRLASEHTIMGCVRTSNGQIAAIRFEYTDNPGNSADRIFHAWFPRNNPPRFGPFH